MQNVLHYTMSRHYNIWLFCIIDYLSNNDNEKTNTYALVFPISRIIVIYFYSVSLRGGGVVLLTFL